MKNQSWSPDACVGNALTKGKFQRSQIVCTKTLYNYIDLGFLSVIKADLPIKLRRNTKPAKVNKHKKNLGKNI
jgi:transposase, IS30 family